MRAAEFVDTRLRACLPLGIPASYISITSASYVGRGKERRALADLIMFDGLPARVSVNTTGLMPHRFTELPGGDVSFEGGRWIRIDPVTLEPFPQKKRLQLSGASHDH